MLSRISRTLPLRTMSQAAHVHSVAAAGFAEGTNDLYDRARPTYPAPALQHIRASIPGKDNTILEPGSGTGIFSRLLLSPPAGYPSFDLAKLVCIEPSSGMRAAWERGLDKLDPSVAGVASTVDGGFDDFSHAGVSPGSADAVIAAQAWHWCPDHERALREIAKYLKPGAPLVLIWNLESNGDAWHKALRELYQPLDLGSPQYYRMRWKAMFDTAAYAELFEPVSDAHFPWEMGMTEDQVMERLFSKSYLTEAHLRGEKRQQFEKDARKIINEGDKHWVDKEKGIFKYKYVTDVWILHKKN